MRQGKRTSAKVCHTARRALSRRPGTRAGPGNASCASWRSHPVKPSLRHSHTAKIRGHSLARGVLLQAPPPRGFGRRAHLRERRARGFESGAVDLPNLLDALLVALLRQGEENRRADAHGHTCNCSEHERRVGGQVCVTGRRKTRASEPRRGQGPKAAGAGGPRAQQTRSRHAAAAPARRDASRATHSSSTSELARARGLASSTGRASNRSAAARRPVGATGSAAARAAWRRGPTEQWAIRAVLPQDCMAT